MSRNRQAIPNAKIGEHSLPEVVLNTTLLREHNFREDDLCTSSKYHRAIVLYANRRPIRLALEGIDEISVLALVQHGESNITLVEYLQPLIARMRYFNRC
ncbi:MAG: hypothetical protein JXB07_20320 [Anaerolineae bacterium]|nr:hypothetical protein [Anaerolineae bacterium]